jgi:hypothetical protein
MTDTDIRIQLLLSVQRALLDAVPATLRAVTCGWAGTEITLQFLFDGSISEDDEESMRMAGTEVIADFPAPWTMAEEIVRFDYPGDLHSRTLPLWAYARKEKTSEGKPLR